MIMRMHTQGKSGWQYSVLQSMGPWTARWISERVDDEQQLLMRWGSTLRPFTARIAATSNQILHQKYLLDSISGFSYVSSLL